jgi:hypothetical protein
LFEKAANIRASFLQLKRKLKKRYRLTVVLRANSAAHIKNIGKIEPSTTNQIGHRILLALQQRPVQAGLSRGADKPATVASRH